MVAMKAMLSFRISAGRNGINLVNKGSEMDVLARYLDVSHPLLGVPIEGHAHLPTCVEGADPAVHVVLAPCDFPKVDDAIVTPVPVDVIDKDRPTVVIDGEGHAMRQELLVENRARPIARNVGGSQRRAARPSRVPFRGVVLGPVPAFGEMFCSAHSPKQSASVGIVRQELTQNVG